MSLAQGEVDFVIDESKIAWVTFYHPKANSLPSHLQKQIEKSFNQISKIKDCSVVVFQSRGNGAFCAGASLDELGGIHSLSKAEKFFESFGNLLCAIRRCNKCVISRVQGKTVGGGVGILSASDYVIAEKEANVRLSEITMNFGPFVIGPFVDRKIGRTAFTELALSGQWKDSAWANRTGLFTEVVEGISELDKRVVSVAREFSTRSAKATAELKAMFWSDTKGFEKLVKARAKKSAALSIMQNK